MIVIIWMKPPFQWLLEPFALAKMMITKTTVANDIIIEIVIDAMDDDNHLGETLF